MFDAIFSVVFTGVDKVLSLFSTKGSNLVVAIVAICVLEGEEDVKDNLRIGIGGIRGGAVLGVDERDVVDEEEEAGGAGGAEGANVAVEADEDEESEEVDSAANEEPDEAEEEEARVVEIVGIGATVGIGVRS